MKKDLLKGLAIMLEQKNNLVKSFVSLWDLILEGKVSKEMELVLHSHKRNRPEHELKYNRPESSEIGALIVGEQHGSLDIVLKRKAIRNDN